MNIPSSLGEPISLEEAQDMIGEYKLLRNGVDITPTASVVQSGTPDLIAATNVFVQMSKDYNAFVFTKDLIMRFFDGTQTDDAGNPIASNYLLVILGAHKEAKTVNNQEFQAGSFTVLTAGCTRKNEKDKNGNDTIKFYPLDMPQPANEYPPTTMVTLQLESEHNINGDSVDYFQVI